MPGPHLPVMLAGVTPGRFNVKLVLLTTPSRVFSSCVAKRPVVGEIFLSLFFSPYVALTAWHPSTKFSYPHKRPVRGGKRFPPHSAAGEVGE